LAQISSKKSLLTLRKRADFLSANRGARFACHAFVLLSHPQPDHPQDVRVGYTVTKKIGNAVVRNRIKRRFRELARQGLPGVAKLGTDYIFIGREAALTRDWADLVADLKRGLGKLHAIRQEREP
jgi:ribonuclease P protein component